MFVIDIIIIIITKNQISLCCSTYSAYIPQIPFNRIKPKIMVSFSREQLDLLSYLVLLGELFINMNANHEHLLQYVFLQMWKIKLVKYSCSVFQCSGDKNNIICSNKMEIEHSKWVWWKWKMWTVTHTKNIFQIFHIHREKSSSTEEEYLIFNIQYIFVCRTLWYRIHVHY